MTRVRSSSTWAAVHQQRAALAEDLAQLDDSQWTLPSLCTRWTIEQVVAHLTAAASIGPARWFSSVLGARFDFDLHNDRRLAEHLGVEPIETLTRFRGVITSDTSAPGPSVAWLGEVLVHSGDIRRPLGLTHAPPVDETSEVARFYAQRNFAVPSRSRIRGLRLESTDGPFTTGDGPQLAGPTVALIMVMAGRQAYCEDLTGPGVAMIRDRCPRPETPGGTGR
jgi:uncharacterized protein (TIGR03083 family)